MAQSGEIADDLKNPEHVIPMDVWNKIREDAEKEAKEATADGR